MRRVEALNKQEDARQGDQVALLRTETRDTGREVHVVLEKINPAGITM